MSQALLSSVESMCVALAQSASLAANITASVYAGVGNLDVEAPAIVCIVPNGRLAFPTNLREMQEWHLKVEIHAKEMIADTDPTGSIASAIFAAFDQGQGTIDYFNNLAFGPKVAGCYEDDSANAIPRDSWDQVLNLEIICAALPPNS